VESTDSTPTENRFSALECDEMMVEEDDTGSSSPTIPPQALPKRTPKKHKPCNNEEITINKVHVFCGDKTAWQVIPESPDTSCIVVGDSNLRNMKNIPEYWQVNALPGAHLGDFTNGLATLKGEPKQFTIILQAGINHRCKHDVDSEQEILFMLYTIRRNQATNEVIFNGVSIPPDMPETEAQRLVALNNFMKSELGELHYIEPLDSALVRVQQTDPWQIHYDQDTVDKITHKMISHTKGSDF
jgi:hypothetical protein